MRESAAANREHTKGPQACDPPPTRTTTTKTLANKVWTERLKSWHTPPKTNIVIELCAHSIHPVGNPDLTLAKDPKKGVDGP